MREIYLENHWLRQVDGGHGKIGIAITRFPAVVGRHQACDFVLPYPFISRRHCCFYLRGEDVWLQDLGSSNGTSVNDRPAHDAIQVHDGDWVSIGNLPFRARLSSPEASTIFRPDSSSETAAPARTPHQVLVVEDNVDAAETLAMVLKTWGHEVQVAHDGVEAIEAAMRNRPDTILMDIRLPGMDGFQVAQQLRNLKGLEEAMMVAISGYDLADDPDRTGEAEFDAILSKPVDPQKLREVISQPA